MFSIYTSLYNLNNGFIDWKAALDNFCAFAEQVVIATLPGEKNILLDYIGYPNFIYPENIKVIVADNLSLNDLDFDGKLKNIALKQCSQPFCILLDGDERINLKDRPKFEKIASYLEDNRIDACFIPVIDLFNSEKEYKSVGQKWYLHRNKLDINRGVVNFAKKDDGKIDINRSDTCELIYNNGNLVNAYYLINPASSHDEKIDHIKRFDDPVIYHLGWLDKEKRLKSNEFWHPVWENRAGKEVKNIIHKKEELDKIEYWKHGLKLWYE